jgi:hypothetical protein
MTKVNSDKFKVLKIEKGQFEYDTIFIEINEKSIQIPIAKSTLKDKQIIGKNIKIPHELIGENEYLFNKEITEIEFDK